MQQNSSKKSLIQVTNDSLTNGRTRINRQISVNMENEAFMSLYITTQCYIRKPADKYRHDVGCGSKGTFYYIIDRQGNNIAVFSDKGRLEQQTTYYPYGEPVVEPAGQRYLFGGKEREHAGGRNSTDFGPRSLTPTGSWSAADRPAEIQIVEALTYGTFIYLHIYLMRPEQHSCGSS